MALFGFVFEPLAVTRWPVTTPAAGEQCNNSLSAVPFPMPPEAETGEANTYYQGGRFPRLNHVSDTFRWVRSHRLWAHR